ncbi:insulinase family protein [Roseateles sp.]|uniref:insulinase family protein n=1 Tax=Roseateles sp. TaxID=1971397 RepID=UPI0031E24A86
MFTLVSRHPLPVLQATLEQYVAEASGTRHVHLRTESDELAFLVGFPTVPEHSDGRAHILEHLALCGSERFPVADPFFAMMRRSTATFMNAMTYADRTVYPFATTDRADFFNLMDVYLDATFFPKLDYLSFRQEGWRHVVKPVNGASSGASIGYQGVVLNEMKGAYGNPMRIMDRGLDALLFEGTTYAVDSGGDPLVIPELTHEALLAFHASHYHPSQAFFLTAGRIEAAEIQARIAEQVLQRKPGRQPLRMPGLAPAWTQPRLTDIRIPSAEARADEFGVQLAWRMSESRDALSTARFQLLARGLLGDASAPVLKAMESAGFGRPSRMNGVNPGARQLSFHLGMEGLTEDQIEPARTCMLRALEAAARDGVPASVFEAAIRDMRVSQREIRGGGMPDALSRLLGAVPALMYGIDVLPAFDNEAVLAVLEREFADPETFKRLVRELLAHETFLVARILPDATFASERGRIEAERLVAQSALLSDADLKRIADEDAALVAHRSQGSRTDMLPRIRPQDLSREPRRVPAISEPRPGVAAVEVASNGVSYATLAVDLGGFERADWPWLALYVDMVGELGAGDMGYEQAAAWRQRKVPGFSIYLDALVGAGKDTADDAAQETVNGESKGKLITSLCIHASGLQEQHADLVEVIRTWADAPRFDEIERIAFLARSLVEDRLTGLPNQSDRLASLTATAPLSARQAFDDATRGVASLPFLHALKAQLQEADGPARVAATLAGLQARLLAAPRRITWVASQPLTEDLLELVPPQAGAAASTPAAGASPTAEPANAALLLSGQVNHCFIAWPAPGMTHADAAPLALAAELLTHRVLHRRLREEGGAYGGSAGYSSEDGLFTMSSYRDPRLAATYADFHAALDELLAAEYSQEALEEAILGVVKRLDKPLSPQGQGMEAVRLARRGVTLAQRAAYRDAVLDCTLEQVHRAADLWLKRGRPSRAAAATTADQDLAGLQPVEVLRAPAASVAPGAAALEPARV